MELTKKGQFRELRHSVRGRGTVQKSRAAFSKSDTQSVFDLVLAKNSVEILETEREVEQNAKGRGREGWKELGSARRQVRRWYMVRGTGPGQRQPCSLWAQLVSNGR